MLSGTDPDGKGWEEMPEKGEEQLGVAGAAGCHLVLVWKWGAGTPFSSKPGGAEA